MTILKSSFSSQHRLLWGLNDKITDERSHLKSVRLGTQPMDRHQIPEITWVNSVKILNFQNVSIQFWGFIILTHTGWIHRFPTANITKSENENSTAALCLIFCCTLLSTCKA